MKKLSLKDIFPAYTGMEIEDLRADYEQFKADVQDYYDTFDPAEVKPYKACPLEAGLEIAGGLDFFATMVEDRHIVRYPHISVLKKVYSPTAPKEKLEFLSFDEVLEKIVWFHNECFDYVEDMRLAVEETRRERERMKGKPTSTCVLGELPDSNCFSRLRDFPLEVRG